MLKITPLLALVLATGLAGGCRRDRQVEAVPPGGAVMSPALAQAVETNIRNMQGVDAGNVRVDAFGDQVLLSGTVPSEQDRTRLVEAARQTSGVAEVHDRLTLTPAMGAQQPMGGEAMRQVGSLNGTDVRMRIADGTATLTGQVPSQEAKQAAERLARQAPGVNNVNNQLTVGQQGM